jgi:hypothetical protein
VLGRDTPENRILKAALEAGLRWLHQQPWAVVPPDLWHWGNLGRAALNAVPVQRISPRDWTTARRYGAMRHYAEPLALARLVLTRLHLDPLGGAEENPQTVPFFLDANRLFEAWVGVCLAHAGCQPDAQQKCVLLLPNVRDWRFRPDFVVSLGGGARRAIVDAKYKLRLDYLGNPDLFQVIGYTRLAAPNGEPTDDGCQGGGQPAVEAWLAVPELGLPPELPPEELSVEDALEKFTTAWKDRTGMAACWPDGFKFGVVKVALPTIAARGEADRGG